jgi:hypothetical protein
VFLQEESERVKAEVAATVQATAMRFERTNFSYSQNDFMFSLDDFEGKVTKLLGCLFPYACSV